MSRRSETKLAPGSPHCKKTEPNSRQITPNSRSLILRKVCPNSRNSDHNFPDLLVRLQIPESLHRVLVRECFRNLRNESSIRKPVVDVLPGRIQAVEIECDFANTVRAQANEITE